jgi:hypothetical protein
VGVLEIVKRALLKRSGISYCYQFGLGFPRLEPDIATHKQVNRFSWISIQPFLLGGDYTFYPAENRAKAMFIELAV